MRSCDDRHVLVLASGGAARRGGSTSLMESSGRAWWLVQKGRLDRTGVPASWVVSRAERMVLSRDPRSPTRLILTEEEGSLSAFLRGVEVLEADPPAGVFVLPIQTPAPEPAVWDHLCDAGGLCAPSYHGQRGCPLHLPWAAAVSLMGEVVSRRTRRVRLESVVAAMVTDVEVDDPAVVAVIREPGDIRRWMDLSLRPAGGA